MARPLLPGQPCRRSPFEDGDLGRLAVKDREELVRAVQQVRALPEKEIVSASLYDASQDGAMEY